MNQLSKIYIAGHTGMVGSAIARKLREKGYRNLTGKTIEELDLTDQQKVAEYFSVEKPEYVILAAAKVGGIIANNTYRGQFIYENLMIQNNIIHQSYLHGVKKLLFLGSSCIYPKNCPQPIKEEYLLTGELEYTNEPYAIAKIAGLKLCESYNLQYGTNFIAVMPTNLYGSNDNYNLETSHVLPALIRKFHLGRCLETNDWEALRKDLGKRPIENVDGNASENIILDKLAAFGISSVHSPQSTVHRPQSPLTNSPVTITLWGSGKPFREFLHVDDLADACVHIFETVNFGDLKNTHINIGSGKDLTIRELANMVQKIVGFDGEIRWDTDKPDGTFRKRLDTGKLKKLHWKSRIDLRSGLEQNYAFYVEQL